MLIDYPVGSGPNIQTRLIRLRCEAWGSWELLIALGVVEVGDTASDWLLFLEMLVAVKFDSVPFRLLQRGRHAA